MDIIPRVQVVLKYQQIRQCNCKIVDPYFIILVGLAVFHQVW